MSSSQWSNNAPQENGYYWFREDENDEPIIVEVKNNEVFWASLSGEPVEDWLGEWVGPILPPDNFNDLTFD